MREIKFRAFYNGRMEYMNNKTPAWLGDILSDPNFYNPTQYTGLKDRNGKEIYDGDIYALHTGKTPTKSSIFYQGYVIKNHDPFRGFDFETIWTNRVRKDDPIYRPNDRNCTVIGNIYETPELLEKK